MGEGAARVGGRTADVSPRRQEAGHTDGGDDGFIFVPSLLVFRVLIVA